MQLNSQKKKQTQTPTPLFKNATPLNFSHPPPPPPPPPAPHLPRNGCGRGGGPGGRVGGGGLLLGLWAPRPGRPKQIPPPPQKKKKPTTKKTKNKNSYNKKPNTTFLTKQPRQPSLQIFGKENFHGVVDGNDAGDVAFVVYDGQGEQVVFGDRLGDLFGGFGRVGVAKLFRITSASL